MTFENAKTVADTRAVAQNKARRLTANFIQTLKRLGLNTEEINKELKQSFGETFTTAIKL